MSQSKNKYNNDQLMRHSVEKTEVYNHSLLPKNSSTTVNRNSKATMDDVTEQILFCQNEISSVNLSTRNNNLTFNETYTKESSPVDEVLMVDIVSNGYKNETSSFELNVTQQCSIISIISPYAFTIQLTQDVSQCEEFFKNMNDYYNSIDDLQIPEEYLRPNLLCVTWDEAAAAWNRSQIMEYDLNEDTVNVFFADLNSWEENVPRSRIRFILTKYSSRHVHLLTCHLASIAPLNNNNNQWNDVASKTFQNVVLNCQCDVEPLSKRCDGTFYVNLFARHDEAYVCVNDFLIHCQMAQPMDNIDNDENVIYVMDEDGRPMHAMIALYWKAGETIQKTEASITDQEYHHQAATSNVSLQSELRPLTKVVQLNKQEKIIFAKCDTHIMIPWFTVASVLSQLDEEKIKILANKLGFKAIIIDPLSHPFLCSQLLKLVPPMAVSSQISLYSIDCVRELFHTYQYTQPDTFDLLDRARLAEASGDTTFWDQSYDVGTEEYV